MRASDRSMGSDNIWRGALVFAAIAIVHVAAAEPPKRVSMREAIAAFVPGLSEADGRRIARALGCDDNNPSTGQWNCVFGEEPALESWTLWFEQGRLERVEYHITVDLDRLDATAARTARRTVDRRASELEAAANATDGRRTRARINSSVASGRRTVWPATRRRASRLGLAVWEENGQESEYNLAFELVARDAAFASYALSEDWH